MHLYDVLQVEAKLENVQNFIDIAFNQRILWWRLES